MWFLCKSRHPHEDECTNLCISFGFPTPDPWCGKRVLPGQLSCWRSAKNKHVACDKKTTTSLFLFKPTNNQANPKCDYATQKQLGVISSCRGFKKKPKAIQEAWPLNSGTAVKEVPPGTRGGWDLRTGPAGSEMTEQTLCYTGKPSAEGRGEGMWTAK